EAKMKVAGSVPGAVSSPLRGGATSPAPQYLPAPEPPGAPASLLATVGLDATPPRMADHPGIEGLVAPVRHKKTRGATHEPPPLIFLSTLVRIFLCSLVEAYEHFCEFKQKRA